MFIGPPRRAIEQLARGGSANRAVRDILPANNAAARSLYEHQVVEFGKERDVAGDSIGFCAGREFRPVGTR